MEFAKQMLAVAADVRSKKRHAKNEATTRAFLIEPFIRALGYDPQNPNDVEPEFSAGLVANNKKVDYALIKDGKPIIFIEVKSATTDLSHKHTEQLQIYFMAKLAVRLGILTNGKEYRFYSDLNNQNLMDNEPFLVVNMLKLDEANAANLSVFRNSSFDLARAKSHALGLKYKLTLRSVLEKEFRSPSDELIKLFIKRIRPELKQVGKKVTSEMKPIIEEVWREFAHGAKDNRPPPPPPPKPTSKTIPADVVEIPVFASHKGHRFEATLQVDEIMNWHKKEVKVRFEGELMSCAAATLRALRTVSPDRQTGKSSWLFWRFRHPDSGTDLPIKVIYEDVQKGGSLRQQFRDNASS